MTAVLCFAAWEWINIALEYTASSWVRLPRWFLAVLCVNLVTHPAFSLLLCVLGRSTTFILGCEAVIFLLEAFLLMAMYGFARWRLLLMVSLAMNATSYLAGVLIAL